MLDIARGVADVFHPEVVLIAKEVGQFGVGNVGPPGVEHYGGCGGRLLQRALLR
jgi:hypothetical protein